MNISFLIYKQKSLISKITLFISLDASHLTVVVSRFSSVDMMIEKTTRRRGREQQAADSSSDQTLSTLRGELSGEEVKEEVLIDVTISIRLKNKSSVSWSFSLFHEAVAGVVTPVVTCGYCSYAFDMRHEW